MFVVTLWSQIIFRRRSKFLRPRLVVLLVSKTALRPAHILKNSKQFEFFSMCAPGRNRTCNNGLEVRSYIHLTTGAYLTHLR